MTRKPNAEAAADAAEQTDTEEIASAPTDTGMSRSDRGKLGAKARWGDQRGEQRDGQRLQRVRVDGDRFAYDKSRQPEGMAYQWIVTSIMGQADTRQNTPMMMNHWTPVPAKRHREVAGHGPKDDDAIIIDGLMLCERPAYLNEEARAEERQRAAGQVRAQAQRLGLAPDGTLSDGGRRQAQLSRTMDRMVPEDAS